MRSYTQTYDYDEVGNILGMFHTATSANWNRHYTYDSSSNKLATTEMPGDPSGGPYSGTYDHDERGNMTAMPHLSTIAWDWADRMQSADLGGGGTVYFVYDSAGQRVRKVWDKTSALRDERIYLGGYEIWRESTVSGGTATVQEERQTLHVMDDVRRIAMVETLTVTGGSTVTSPTSRQRYQLADQLESTCVEVKEDGSIISYEEYFAFGATSFRSETGEVSKRRYRYNGKERDEETALHYYGARYYAAWLGRWTAVDPSGRGVDNAYAYVRNRPTTLVDPDGRQDTDPNVQGLRKRLAAQFGQAAHLATAAAFLQAYIPFTARKARPKPIPKHTSLHQPKLDPAHVAAAIKMEQSAPRTDQLRGATVHGQWESWGGSVISGFIEHQTGWISTRTLKTQARPGTEVLDKLTAGDLGGALKSYLKAAFITYNPGRELFAVIGSIADTIQSGLATATGAATQGERGEGAGKAASGVFNLALVFVSGQGEVGDLGELAGDTEGAIGRRPPPVGDEFPVGVRVRAPGIDLDLFNQSLRSVRPKLTEAGFAELPKTATGRVGFERLERLSGGRTRLYEVDFDPEAGGGGHWHKYVRDVHGQWSELNNRGYVGAMGRDNPVARLHIPGRR